MKQGTSKVAALATLMFGALLLGACSGSGLPEVFGSAPLAMDKAGASVSIDFTLTQAQIDHHPRSMVALDITRTSDLKLEDAMEAKGMPVAVQVVQLEHGAATPVPMQDYEDSYHHGRRTTQPVVNMHLYAWDGTTSFVFITGFFPAKPGNYRATVKTVEDQPLFTGVNGVIRIGEYYNTGE